MAVIREVVAVILLVVAGLQRLLTQSRDLRELEQGIFRLVQDAVLRLLRATLEQLDETAMKERDRQRLKLVHSKARSVQTPFGELQLERRYYLDLQTGKGRFLLDEAIGLARGQRLSPWTTELAVMLAAEMSYHRVPAVLEQISLGAVRVSPMTVWHAAQEAGKKLVRGAQAQRQALFDQGEVPKGQQRSAKLRIEADETLVAGRAPKGQRRHIAVKLVVGYDGKLKVGPERRVLAGRRVMAGVSAADAFWEQAVAAFANQWDLEATQECTVGGDGAAWVKSGLHYFPNATYRLDPYHLRKALLTALGHDETGYREVSAALVAGDWEATQQALAAAKRRSRGSKRQRVAALEHYLAANWEGILSSGSAESLGAIEGQVHHHLARRMKRHGARWSEQGADHMARLLAARANGELVGVARQTWQAEPRILQKAAEPLTRIHRGLSDDPAAWLRAHLPVLHSSVAGAPWVKHVLRALAEAAPATA